MRRCTFKKLAIVVLGLYFIVTCYTGYMVLKRKLEKYAYPMPESKDISNDNEWNPWGQEFEKEHQKTSPPQQTKLQVPNAEQSLLDSDDEFRDSDHIEIDANEVVEIWGKAAIGLYLWQHILRGTFIPKLGGIWSYGSLMLDNIEFRFRTGPGVVPSKVPKDTRNLVLVLNGRTQKKIDFATVWLDYLPNLQHLENVAVVLLGNEKCDNQWLQSYMTKNGGPVKVVFLVYDSPEIDDENFFQWPLGVATYRDFPVVSPRKISPALHRSFTCNFMGSLYPNSSRTLLLKQLQQLPNQQLCQIRARSEWLPNESSQSREDYIKALKDSDLTLNPVGKNTECYRLYEAMSLGSVPVVEDIMTPGNCGGKSPYPLRLLKQHNAPFILLSNWSNIGKLIEMEHERPHEEMIRRRETVLIWYEEFLEKMKWRFVRTMKRKFFITAK